MAYDEDLAMRVREATAATEAITEMTMFGGLAFLRAGKMAVAVSGQGGLMVRADPAEADDLVASTAATPMVMGDRVMSGWLRVAAEDLADDDDLRTWVDVGLAYAGALAATS